MSRIVDVSEMFKDMYAAPGTTLKQWVVDTRRETAWEYETCPRVFVPTHIDNTGLQCRNSGQRLPWTYLEHDCCAVCCDFHEELKTQSDVRSWLAEKAQRPPIEQDRTKLSDEVQEDINMRQNPIFAFMVKS